MATREVIENKQCVAVFKVKDTSHGEREALLPFPVLRGFVLVIAPSYFTTTFLPLMMLMPFCGALRRWPLRLKMPSTLLSRWSATMMLSMLVVC